MIDSVLVANRGEIARRIFRTCRELGIATVAVYSDADRTLPFVGEADRAVRIGGPSAAASYLDLGKLLDAAHRSGAKAVHPGYGFLAENANFAQSVIDAGLIWIGPPPTAIALMGDKSSARRLATEAEVPTVPGYDGDDQRDATLIAAAAGIGFPILVKAAAGGGGRGMRRVNEAAELQLALEGARREAKASFDDDKLLLERCLERPRHIEIQVLADAHGNAVHLLERECSIQRRHQKIVEEAPSPAVDAALRKRMGDAAVRITQRAGYVGAGTVEFLLADGEFFFLEMNTRLQVEHPVTEAITHTDLVALQLTVAEGRTLPLSQETLTADGHAIEVRLYAEDPAQAYLPATGLLERLRFPAEIRVDAGYAEGDSVGIHYDPMLAKLIAWGPDRQTATRRLRRALDRSWIAGVKTNRGQLRAILAHPAWAAGALHTAFLDEHQLHVGSEPFPLAPAIAAVRGWLSRRGRFPAAVPLGWRLRGAAPATDQYQVGTDSVEVTWRELSADSVEVTVEGKTHRIVVLGENRLEIDGVCGHFEVTGQALESGAMHVLGGSLQTTVTLLPRLPTPGTGALDAGSCVAPTPGTVVAVHVTPGQTVAAGAPLVTIEAMKMEHTLAAPTDGTIAEVRVTSGDAVDQDALLVRMETETD